MQANEKFHVYIPSGEGTISITEHGDCYQVMTYIKHHESMVLDKLKYVSMKEVDEAIEHLLDPQR